MSNTKKTVKITESELVDLIDNIVSEAVSIKKQEWIAEQAKKGDKSSILESRIAELEAKFKNLAKSK
jgi:hypothetical protein